MLLPNRSPKSSRIVSSLLVLLLLGGMSFGIKMYKRAAAADRMVKVRVESTLQTRNPVKVIQITALRTGLRPATLSVPTGRYLLAIDNRSGVDNLNMQFGLEGSLTMRQASSRRATPDWRGVVDLTPGKYNLTIAERPQWRCALTVTQ